MRRKTDPRPSMVAAFLVGALVLLHGVLAGGAAIVQRYGFGLAGRWEEVREEDPLMIEELDRLDEPEIQVVEIDRPEREQKPLEDTAFRSEFDSRVKEQTQAQLKAIDPRAVASVISPPPREAVGPRPRARPSGPARKEAESEPGPSPLAMRLPEPAPSPGDGAEKDEAPSRPAPARRALSVGDLKPSTGVLQRNIPTAFPDYLKDIDFGEQTLLNTKEWKFASFFNRVKRAVAEHWHPDREYSRRDPKGNVYGFKTRFTVLHVILDSKGRIQKIILERPSGLTFLDNEAIRAFREAGPFPNPPSRLVNRTTGRIAFRFGFIFEITRSPSWRMFRLRD